MIDVVEMTERHAAALARVAAMAERLAAKHADRALETDDPKVEASATAAFQRATRVMRQSMALEAKLIRDAEQAGREAVARADHRRSNQEYDRRRQVQATLERLIRNDPGISGDAEHLCNELDDLLDVEELAETFLTEDLTTQVARLCKDLGLTGFEVMAVLPNGPSDPPDRHPAHPRESGDPGFFR